MNSSSVTVRQRGVGLQCRPIGQQRSCCDDQLNPPITPPRRDVAGLCASLPTLPPRIAAKTVENPRLSWDGGEIRRETDCLLEENGFENSVPRCLATAISAGLHSTTEADDCSDDTATPTVDRPQLGRSLETAAYLARNRKTLWGGRRGRGNFVAACNRWSAAMPQPNDLSSSLVAPDQNSTIIAVVELSQSSCGRAPPAWVTWQVAVAREQSGQTWREYRARFGCEAIADSDRRGTGVCHHRSRSAATTIPTRPTTAIARIRSARQSAAKWNQPAIAQSTAGRRWRIANRRCPTRVTVGQSCRSIEHRHFGGVALACSAGSGLLRFLHLRRTDHGVRCISGLAGHLPPP